MLKPGFKTSEFWISVAVIFILSGLSVIVIIFGKAWWKEIVTGCLATCAFLKGHLYNVGRVKLKLQQYALEKAKAWIDSKTPANDDTPVITPVAVITPSPQPPPIPLMVQTTDSVTTPQIDNEKITVTTKVMPKSTVITTTVK